MGYLSDENSYVYGAAERALSRMGEAVLAPAVERIESGDVDPDAAHSLLVLLCDLGTRAAYDAVTRHMDWFMDSIGAGETAEWIGVFGIEELIDPLRDWLDDDPALVGQALLLLGAIHNVTIPEEDEILQGDRGRARAAGRGWARRGGRDEPRARWRILRDVRPGPRPSPGRPGFRTALTPRDSGSYRRRRPDGRRKGRGADRSKEVPP